MGHRPQTGDGILPRGDNHAVAKTSIRERLAHSAFELFDERGYDETTVDDITVRAGVGRSTFFRYYRTKDDVIFPDHDDLLAKVEARLSTSTASAALVAVCEAVRIVLSNYVEDRDFSLARYQLVREVPTLRQREIVSGARYQLLFRQYISAWLADAPDAALRAELMSACVVAAHNQVLRRWLRSGGRFDPFAELDHSLEYVVDTFMHDEPPVHPRAPEDDVLIIAVKASAPARQITSAIKNQLQRGR